MGTIPWRSPSGSPTRARRGSTWWIWTARSATARTWRSCAAIVAAVGGRVRVQLGGGLRTLALVREGLEQGVTRVVIGTAAAIDPAIVPAGGRRGGRRSGSPWASTRATARSRSAAGPRLPTSPPKTLARRVGGRRSRARVVYTDVARDGMLDGPRPRRRAPRCRRGRRRDRERRRRRRRRHPRGARGGLAGAIVGRALYEGRFTLAEALEAAAAAPR